jgi:hypothetical protein
MYEPYPVSEPPQHLGRARPPRTVLRAVRLMYAGAALEVAALIVALVTRGSLESAIVTAHPHYTSAQVHTAENFRAGLLATGALIAVGGWLWMAWANGSGRSWAKGVSAALFVIGTLGLPIVSFRAARNAATLIIGVLIWLVGLAVIVLIFNNSSGPFYRTAQVQTVIPPPVRDN